MFDLLMPILVFGLMTIIILAFIRLLETMVLGGLIKAALRDHPESVPTLLAKVGERRPQIEEIYGWMLLALALGLVAYAASGGGREPAETARIAIIPAIIGVVVIGYRRLKPRRTTGV
jgi:hypothetical protein